MKRTELRAEYKDGSRLHAVIDGEQASAVIEEGGIFKPFHGFTAATFEHTVRNLLTTVDGSVIAWSVEG